MKAGTSGRKFKSFTWLVEIVIVLDRATCLRHAGGLHCLTANRVLNMRHGGQKLLLHCLLTKGRPPYSDGGYIKALKPMTKAQMDAVKAKQRESWVRVVKLGRDDITQAQGAPNAAQLQGVANAAPAQGAQNNVRVNGSGKPLPARLQGGELPVFIFPVKQTSKNFRFNYHYLPLLDFILVFNPQLQL